MDQYTKFRLKCFGTFSAIFVPVLFIPFTLLGFLPPITFYLGGFVVGVLVAFIVEDVVKTKAQRDLTVKYHDAAPIHAYPH